MKENEGKWTKMRGKWRKIERKKGKRKENEEIYKKTKIEMKITEKGRNWKENQ